MTGPISIYKKDHYEGTVELPEEPDALISVFTVQGPEGEDIPILYVLEMDYAIVISRDIYDRINASLDQQEEEEGY